MQTIIRSRLLSLAASFPLHGAILTVDNNPGAVAMFNNFPDAYAAANDGDTILLAGSSSDYSGVDIYKRLTVVGAGYFLTGTNGNTVPGLNGNSSSISFNLRTDPLIGSASSSRLVGLSGRFDVKTGVAGVVIEKCHDGSSLGIYESPVVVRSCNTGSGMFFNAGSSGSIVTNSICGHITFNTTGVSVDRCVLTSSFSGNPSTSITNSIFVFSSSSSFTRDSSSVSNCMAVGFNTLPTGAGNINGQLVGNVFLNTGSNDGKWRLKAGSPAAGAGTGGSDMGAFGGTNPYVLSGVPGIPRLTRLVVPATATSTSGLQFEVDAQAFPE